MKICYHCGRETSEIYYCSKCGQNYCSLHKEPVDHECNIVIESLRLQQTPLDSTYIDVAQNIPIQSPQEIAEFSNSIVRGTIDGTYTWYRQEKQIPDNVFDPNSGIEFKGIFLAHKSEFLHFLIGIILIFTVGLISFYDVISYSYWALFMLAGFYATAFLFHEFGHRQIAKHFGLQTKFRLLTFGMLLTGITLIMGLVTLVTDSIPLPGLALPGAVVVLGLDKVSRKTGLCKAAGPTVNLIYGSILLAISLIIPISPLNYFIGIAAYFNFMLGSFNMIPFGILDGQNIWKWNKKVYLLLMISLIILLITTLSCIYAPFDTNPYFSK